MPELPEVESARRTLVRWFKNRRVVHAEAPAGRIFRGAERARFGRIRGKLESLGRHGKYLLFHFEDDQGLLGHLGMTGKFVRRPPGQKEPYSRARFVLDSGEVIHYRDPRMFGRLEPVAASRLRLLPVIQALGPDPLEDGLSAAVLQARMGRTRQPIKVALLDQHRVAGVGNLHAAEALFRARIHPARRPASLSPTEWRALTRGIHAAFAFGLKHKSAEEMRYLSDGGGGHNPFLVYDRLGKPCRRCRTPIQRITQAGRSSYFCPHCQQARRVTTRPSRKGQTPSRAVGR